MLKMQLNNEDMHLYMSLVIVTLIPYSFPVLCFLYHKSAFCCVLLSIVVMEALLPFVHCFVRRPCAVFHYIYSCMHTVVIHSLILSDFNCLQLYLNSVNLLNRLHLR